MQGDWLSGLLQVLEVFLGTCESVKPGETEIRVALFNICNPCWSYLHDSSSCSSAYHKSSSFQNIFKNSVPVRVLAVQFWLMFSAIVKTKLIKHKST